MIRLLKHEDVEHRTRALIAITYLTAGRISEVIELRKDQLKKEWPHYLVYNMKVLKRGKKEIVRTVPIRIETDRKFLFFIFSYINRHNSPYLFPSIRGRHIGRRWAHKLISKVFAWPHFLRHLRCSHLAQKGLSAYQLQQFIGWARLETGEDYVRLSAEDLRKVI